MGVGDHEKTNYAVAIFLAFSAASVTFAGTRVNIKDSEEAAAEADMHRRYDHPKTQVVPNDQLQVVVTRDVIMHSCCMPPNLVVAGKITNTSDKPIDYVHLHFAFEDKNGKILHGESLYNHHAESLGGRSVHPENSERETALRPDHAGPERHFRIFDFMHRVAGVLEGRAVFERHQTVARRAAPGSRPDA